MIPIWMDGLWRLPRTTLYAGGFLAVLLICLIIDQQHWWSLRDDYMFGYLVPLFVAWVLYERWPMIRMTLLSEEERKLDPDARAWSEKLAAKREATPIGKRLDLLLLLLVSAASLVGFIGIVFAAIYRAMEGPNLVTTQLLALSFIVLLLGAVYLFSDRRSGGEGVGVRERLALLGLFLFPALIWLLSAPMFNFIEKGISTFLLHKVASTVFFCFDLLGFSIIQEGNILVLPKGEVGVEDACSGIRSLMACLFAGSFLAAVCLPPGWRGLGKKALMVAAAMFFAFVMNIARSVFLTSWAYVHGPESIGEQVMLFGMEWGTVHDVTGFVVIAPVVGALLALLPVFNFQWERPIEQSDAGDMPT